MFNVKTNTARFYKRILLGYWIISCLAIVTYLYIRAISSGEGLQTLLQNQVTSAISFLVAMITLGNFLYLVTKRNSIFLKMMPKVFYMLYWFSSAAC